MMNMKSFPQSLAVIDLKSKQAILSEYNKLALLIRQTQTIRFIHKSFVMDLEFQEISNVSKKLKCGCYVSDAVLNRQYPNKFVMVPLKSSEYNLEIVNSIANVYLIQSYVNPTNKYLQLQYSFPISPNACVYRFVAVFGSKRMEGIVKEKQEARLQYNQAIKQGKQAAYGDLNAESKDILTLKVGNVAPQESVKIQIEYLQQLTLSCNMFYQLHMMGTISPRYMNSIPKDLFLNGLRNEAARVQGKFYWNFKITLKTTRKVHFFDSNSHDIELVSQNDARTESVFAMTKSSVPNKDFIFSYTTQDYHLPSYVLGRTDFSSTAMLSFIPKFCTLSIDDAYKASVAGKGFQTDIENGKGQYIFLLDRSGSMGGSRIQKAKEALVLFIKSLPQDTYFNVISFGSGSSSLFPKSVKYNDKEVNFSQARIKEMDADMGGTQIYQPLNNLLSEQPLEGYPKQIFLLTDGGVSNTALVIKMVSQNNKYSRVHTIGIGNGCSEQLILGCAKKGKGYHVFINDVEQPSSKIIQLLSDSLSPVISKMKLLYDKNMVQSIIPNPQKLPYILKNELVNFYITFKGQLDQPITFGFSYEDSLNKAPYQSEITVEPASENVSFIDRMGHFKQIRLLEQSVNKQVKIQDVMFYVKTVDKNQVIRESVKHQILSEFTAFVCVEKELLDGKYQEIKDTGKVKIEIINPRPIQYHEKMSSNVYGSARKDSFRSITASSSSTLSQNRAKLQEMSARRENCSIKPAMLANENRSSGGFFNSIKSFFTSQKNQQMAPPPAARYAQKQSAPQPMHYAIESCLPKQARRSVQSQKMQQLAFKCESFDQENQSENYDLEKEQVKLETNATSLSISQLISKQSTEGSWKDIGIIGLLFGKDTQKLIASQNNLVAVITYLVCKWIEKYHPEKQYSLLLKKGFNYAKKNADNFDKFSQLYDHLVK